MAERPKLPLEALAEIENERERLGTYEFGLPVKYKYKLLFNAFAGLEALQPFYPKPANLKVELQSYAAEIFNAEARQYPRYATDENELRSWLEWLKAKITSEVTQELQPHAAYHDQHCPSSERLQVIDQKLFDLTQHWVREFRAKVARNEKRIAAKAVPARLPGFIYSPKAAGRMESFLRENNILQKDFAIAVGCDERTLRRFRSTKRIRRDTLQAIAKQMKTTIEQLQ